MDPSSSSAELSGVHPSTKVRHPGDTWKRARAQQEEDDLDMTPMVDVTFLLLIFFMITAAFALQKAIAVPPVEEEEEATAMSMDDLEDDSIVVRVDGDNVYWVICPAWPEEERAVSKQDMRNLVRAARQGVAPSGGAAAAAGSGYAKMLVQASGDATHEFVVAALDAGSGAGVEEIRLVGVEDDF
ncbi:biopolymer transporter ExbD [Botrimarina sp.]|uniref:ExbD/TolR family protein n=1 Tax=Botrimarina sp. TaxID=2795802 RepID=UPI0032EEB1C8